MIKLIVRLIGLLIIGGIIFLALSLWHGGKPFRWLGEKTEQAAVIIKEKSTEMGNEADEIKKKTENMTGTARKMADGVKKVGDKIKNVAGTHDEK